MEGGGPETARDAIRELEAYEPCDIVTLERARSLAAPFGVEIDAEELTPLDEAVPVFFGEERELGISISKLVGEIGHEICGPLETARTADEGFAARARYEHALPKLEEAGRSDTRRGDRGAS